jgi:hypothetical protein
VFARSTLPTGVTPPAIVSAFTLLVSVPGVPAVASATIAPVVPDALSVSDPCVIRDAVNCAPSNSAVVPPPFNSPSA